MKSKQLRPLHRPTRGFRLQVVGNHLLQGSVSFGHAVFSRCHDRSLPCSFSRTTLSTRVGGALLLLLDFDPNAWRFPAASCPASSAAPRLLVALRATPPVQPPA